MDPSIQMRTFNNSKHRHRIYLKFADLFFTSLIMLVLEAKKNLLLYCRKLSVFVTIVII